MSSKTLEQYLVAAIERGQVDHALRAFRAPSGKVTFYVRPLNGDGETLDFVVRDNAMVLNLTSESDVPVPTTAPEPIAATSIGGLSGEPNPVHLAVDLGHAIAKLAQSLSCLEGSGRTAADNLIKAMAGKATELLGGPIAETSQA